MEEKGYGREGQDGGGTWEGGARWRRVDFGRRNKMEEEKRYRRNLQEEVETEKEGRGRVWVSGRRRTGKAGGAADNGRGKGIQECEITSKSHEEIQHLHS